VHIIENGRGLDMEIPIMVVAVPVAVSTMIHHDIDAKDDDINNDSLVTLPEYALCSSLIPYLHKLKGPGYWMYCYTSSYMYPMYKGVSNRRVALAQKNNLINGHYIMKHLRAGYEY
jgi:hypothetical protein